jgi:hypothetical protein
MGWSRLENVINLAVAAAKAGFIFGGLPARLEAAPLQSEINHEGKERTPAAEADIHVGPLWHD